MPQHAYVCTVSTGGCGFKEKRIITRAQRARMTPEEWDKVLHCKKCGRRYHSDPSPPTSQTKEILDNGAMLHRVERPVNAEELTADRSRKDPSKK